MAETEKLMWYGTRCATGVPMALGGAEDWVNRMKWQSGREG